MKVNWGNKRFCFNFSFLNGLDNGGVIVVEVIVGLVYSEYSYLLLMGGYYFIFIVGIVECVSRKLRMLVVD